MKKNRCQKKYIVFLILVLLFTILSFIVKPYYKVEDRVKYVKEFSNDTNKPEPLGWVRVQGTNIDYPVMYYYDVEDISDPSYDLAWSLQNNKKITDRTVILSHNMKNVSSQPLIADKSHARFEQLMGYIYYDFVKENKYVQYTVDGKNYLFKIYAISFQYEKNVIVDNEESINISDYIKDAKENSYFEFDVDVNKNDKLITLVTCTRFFGNTDYSFVVDARLVRKKEIIKNYNVSEKNNYKKIKKKLKGDDSNEEK